MDVNEKRLLRNNPLFVITIACLLALLMSAISFYLYYNSETRRTVELIQQNNQQLNLDEVSDKLPEKLSKEYLDQVEKDVINEVTSHSTDFEFNPEDLSNSSLGL